MTFVYSSIHMIDWDNAMSLDSSMITRYSRKFSLFAVVDASACK
jgi:hypothetical protein